MTQTASVELDPVTLEIYWSRLIAIADQAAATLVRTSFSTIVRECNDYACVLMDVNGDTLAENRGSVPSFVGCLARTMKHFLRYFPRDTWRPGDVVITNDPWMGTGHRPDIVMAAPVFHLGKLVAFTGSIAHAADIGGVIYAADCRSVFEEGIGIPPTRLFSAGKPNDDLLEIIRYNVRVPDMVLGDLFAQVASAEVSSQRLVEFMEEYQIRDLRLLSQVIQGRAEATMRRAIAHVPGGTYHDVVYLDGYRHPLKIEVTITVQGNEMEVDFAGTSDQVEDGGINAVYNYTWAFTTYPIKCLLDPFTYRNEGSYRPLKITAPEGCILNPRYPAPVNARILTGHCISTAVLGALAPALPDRVIADSGSTPAIQAMFNGVGHGGQPFSFLFFSDGGMGARPSADGLSCTPFPTNTAAASVEIMESLTPLVVWKKEFAQDSAGAGKFRGGLGQEVVIEVKAQNPVTLSLLSERWDFPPKGIFGGLGGSANRVERVRGEGPVARKGRTQLVPGDVVRFNYAGGGGYGGPEERDPRNTMEDLRNGLISMKAAREIYHLRDGLPKRRR